jgi:hypothetical protein
MFRLLILLSLIASPLAQAKIYQCQDGSFQDTPCADVPGNEINIMAAPDGQQMAEVWDGLGEIASTETEAELIQQPICHMDYQTRSAIKDGIRAWTVRRCMNMEQVRKVSRGLEFREFSHRNGNGAEVIEWIFNDYQPQRVVFMEGLVVDMR